ncbi:hypothetical protein PHYPSEUDO_011737 [Phytophthora pseudosyringae]|uniref:RWP-RK domain-containing protein n=1 Tax=Phytophthora pseudosyringae TaxID=221518 RepID=A0A8T1V8P6_9STRA|nr:hypothetical protein PHYPSEUDO_011737 [Phytophthora pseudosyringae]
MGPKPSPPPSPCSVKTDVESPRPERKSRRQFEFTLEELQAFSHYRQDEAAKRMGVSPITLKRNCKRHNYRWPFRSIKAALRREALAAQKQQQAARAVAARTNSPPSPSLALPELLLSLGQERKTLLTFSPTSVSDVAASAPMGRAPKAQFPLTNATVRAELPPQLPPLTLLLQKHRMQSTPRTPPHLVKTRPTHQHPASHRSSFYSASFHASAPKFPSRSLASLLKHCEHQRRTDAYSPRYRHHPYKTNL